MGEFLTVGKGKSGTKKLAYNAEGKAAVAEYREKTLVNLRPLKFKKPERMARAESLFARIMKMLFWLGQPH
jgi:hypothetical protein